MRLIHCLAALSICLTLVQARIVVTGHEMRGSRLRGSSSTSTLTDADLRFLQKKDDDSDAKDSKDSKEDKEDKEDKGDGCDKQKKDKSCSPTGAPSVVSSEMPSARPSVWPSASPTKSLKPTFSLAPSDSPSLSSVPSVTPSGNPSNAPSTKPSGSPSVTPSAQPSSTPSGSPSSFPTTAHSDAPSTSPSSSFAPSAEPSFRASGMPSVAPSTSFPTSLTSSGPSFFPSPAPSIRYSNKPSQVLSDRPSEIPSSTPTDSFEPSVSLNPSSAPSQSLFPSASPAPSVSIRPTSTMSEAPTGQPSDDPQGFDTKFVEPIPGVAGFESICRPDVPPEATSTRDQLISFDYTLNVESGADISMIVSATEIRLHTALSNKVMNCTFAEGSPFYTLMLSSLPADKDTISNCEGTDSSECYNVGASITTTIFYLGTGDERKLVESTIADGDVFDAYTASLEEIFDSGDLNMTKVLTTDFTGISNAEENMKDSGDAVAGVEKEIGPDGGSNGGLIAGGIIGGVVVCLLVALALFVGLKRNEANEKYQEQVDDDEDNQSAELEEFKREVMKQIVLKPVDENRAPDQSVQKEISEPGIDLAVADEESEDAAALDALAQQFFISPVDADSTVDEGSLQSRSFAIGSVDNMSAITGSYLAASFDNATASPRVVEEASLKTRSFELESGKRHATPTILKSSPGRPPLPPTTKTNVPAQTGRVVEPVTTSQADEALRALSFDAGFNPEQIEEPPSLRVSSFDNATAKPNKRSLFVPRLRAGSSRQRSLLPASSTGQDALNSEVSVDNGASEGTSKVMDNGLIHPPHIRSHMRNSSRGSLANTTDSGPPSKGLLGSMVASISRTSSRVVSSAFVRVGGQSSTTAASMRGDSGQPPAESMRDGSVGQPLSTTTESMQADGVGQAPAGTVEGSSVKAPSTAPESLQGASVARESRTAESMTGASVVHQSMTAESRSVSVSQQSTLTQSTQAASVAPASMPSKSARVASVTQQSTMTQSMQAASVAPASRASKSSMGASLVHLPTTTQSMQDASVAPLSVTSKSMQGDAFAPPLTASDSLQGDSVAARSVIDSIRVVSVGPPSTTTESVRGRPVVQSATTVKSLMVGQAVDGGVPSTHEYNNKHNSIADRVRKAQANVSKVDVRPPTQVPSSRLAFSSQKTTPGLTQSESIEAMAIQDDATATYSYRQDYDSTVPRARVVYDDDDTLFSEMPNEFFDPKEKKKYSQTPKFIATGDSGNDKMRDVTQKYFGRQEQEEKKDCDISDTIEL